MAKLLWLGMVVFTTTVWGAPGWYDTEVIHNAVHDIEHSLWTWNNHRGKGDPASLDKSFKAFGEAVDALHTDLHDEKKENDPKIITQTFRKMAAPLRRLMGAVRDNQLRTGKKTEYLYDALEVMGQYSQLVFWMTPNHK